MCRVTSSKPEIRAALPLELISMLRRRGSVDAVLDGLPADVRERLDLRSFVSWVDFDDFYELLASARRVVGSDEAHSMLWYETHQHVLRNRVIRGFIGMLRPMSDNGLATVLKQSGRMHGYFTRHAGTLHGSGSDSDDVLGQLELRDFHRRDEGFHLFVQALTGVIGSLDSVMPLTFDVRLAESIPGRGFARFEVRSL